VILDLLKTKMTNIASYVTCTLDRKAGEYRTPQYTLLLVKQFMNHVLRPYLEQHC